MVGDVSDEFAKLKTLGTVMNFEPSLFVYFAVFLELGDGGDWAACRLWFAGIPIKGGVEIGSWMKGAAPRTHVQCWLGAGLLRMAE
jgi:hypothetical protein